MNVDEPVKWSVVVRRLREARGMSQTQLAASTGIIGWDQSVVSRIEAGSRNLQTDEIDCLAVFFKQVPFDFYNRSEAWLERAEGEERSAGVEAKAFLGAVKATARWLGTRFDAGTSAHDLDELLYEAGVLAITEGRFASDDRVWPVCSPGDVGIASPARVQAGTVKRLEEHGDWDADAGRDQDGEADYAGFE